MCAKVERLRDFVGLETSNMMRIASTAADIIKTKLVSGKRVNATIAHTWLLENVRWGGAFHCPDVQTVERHIASWAAFQKDLKVLSIIDTALRHYGRAVTCWTGRLSLP